MSVLTVTLYQSVYDSLEEARAVIRIGDVAVSALCSQLEVSRAYSEQGAVQEVPSEVRFLSSDESAYGRGVVFADGSRIEIARNGDGPFSTYRITGRRVIGGVVALTLGGVA